MVTINTTARPDEKTIVTEPGFYDMSDEVYHADPVPAGSISQSSVKKFLSGTPAAYKWSLDHPKAPNTGMTLGTYVHAVMFGQPYEVSIYEGKAKTWTAKDSAEFRKEALTDGKIPLLTSEKVAGDQMIGNLYRNEEAMRLIQGRDGEHVMYEQAGFAVDPVTGAWLRGKFDILGETRTGGPRIGDLKTTAKPISEQALAKSIHEFGYHIQVGAYRHIVSLLTDTPTENIPFDFIFVSSVEPYEVAVISLTDRAMRLGEQQYGDGLDRLVDCIKTDHWPGLPEKMVLDLPGWAYRATETTTDAERGARIDPLDLPDDDGF